jgi:hypothetical protein
MIYASPDLEVMGEYEDDDSFYAPTIFFPTVVVTIIITVGQTVII